jgi:glycosyltransferase involved in cell wall biosynthesis
MIFSIVICTYNGAIRLPATLRHLAALEIPDGASAELLLINNACTDDTDNVVINCWQQFGVPFKIHMLHMPIPGKSNALQMGVSKAAGDFIIICDDDNGLNPDYLLQIQKLMQHHPSVGIAGGLAVPIADISFPEWFEHYGLAYAFGAQMQQAGFTTGKVPLWGAGMVIRTSLAKRIFAAQQPFLLSCRKGDQLLSGGDDEICYRGWLLGADSYYSPTLSLKHYMPEARLTAAYRDQLVAGFTHQVPVVGAYRRLYELVGQKKVFFDLRKQKKWLAFQAYKLQGKHRQAAHAADFLYFLTRHPRWQTETNDAVWRFYESAGMPLGKP